jgi:Ran GTPase-activating protein (RanGAP) involved in mRNA processing and transport
VRNLWIFCRVLRLEVLLRSKDSKVKVVLDNLSTNTVGFRALMQELGRNTTITNLAIRDCLLSRENVEQLKALLRQNTALQSLDLTSSTLRGSGRDFFETLPQYINQDLIFKKQWSGRYQVCQCTA